MSSTEVDDEVCANCGKAAVDDIKLKFCTACKLVKYCSVDCQKNHRPQHKKACKKRAAEIRDDQLFRQPDESHLGECPLCCLPLPLDPSKFWVASCCCKHLCIGCEYANKNREREQGLEHKCPYCREPLSKSDKENKKNHMKRVKANDPIALCELGKEYRDEGDYNRAFQYFTKAAELGHADAHFEVSILYQLGQGVGKDEKKRVYHLEEAVIGGHPLARCSLGYEEMSKGRHDRATRHFIIAANLGLDDALEAMKKGFQRGIVSKEDYEVALRGHQAAVDATKSEQREEGYAFDNFKGMMFHLGGV